MFQSFSKFTRICALFFLFPSATVLASPSWSELKAQVDAKIQKHFDQLHHSQVGVVVGVIREGETRVWSYGERILGSGEFPTEDHFFEIGSITKTFTATLLALEVLRGHVQLHDPLKTYWPELEGTDAGEITFEQLATHSSGLPRMPNNFNPQDQNNPYKDYDETLLFKFLKSYQANGKAPFPYRYSNVGMGLLGYVLAQKINHQNYGDYLTQNLLKPLHLENTKTILQSEDHARAAQGYGDFFDPIPFWDLNALEAAGVLKTTLKDLLIYMKLNLNPDQSEIGHAIALTHQDRAPTHLPQTRIGLGWHRWKQGKHSVIGHSGATGGYRADFIFDPTQDLGAIVLSNTSIAPECVLSPVFEDTLCTIPSYAKIDSSVLKNHTGHYFSNNLQLNLDVFFQDGFLGLLIQNQPKIRLFAHSDLKFLVSGADSSIEFIRKPDGVTSGFTLDDGQEFFEFVKNSK